jgi:hypothetical protein
MHCTSIEYCVVMVHVTQQQLNDHQVRVELTKESMRQDYQNLQHDVAAYKSTEAEKAKRIVLQNQSVKHEIEVCVLGCSVFRHASED